MLQPWTATSTSTINWQSFFPPNDAFGAILVHDPALLQNQRRYQDQPNMQVNRTQKSANWEDTKTSSKTTYTIGCLLLQKLAGPGRFFWATCAGTFSCWIPPKLKVKRFSVQLCQAFICYIVLNSFMMLNMLVGILVEAMDSRFSHWEFWGVLRCLVNATWEMQWHSVSSISNVLSAVTLRLGREPWHLISLCNILGSGWSDSFEVRSWLWLHLF